MPGRNIVKIDSPNTFYHVYARGNRKMPIYQDNEDYHVFLNLLKRYLGEKICKDPCGRPYLNLREEVELNCYCLMPNHFHVLLFQKEIKAMANLMKNVMASYSRYFNKKYGYSGSLFETTYRASAILSDEYLLHISRYIHLNPDRWESYKYSSLPYFKKRQKADWLNVNKISELFPSTDEYLNFLRDYEDYKKFLQDLKIDLADK